MNVLCCFRFLFEIVLLARKCALICIALLVPDPFLSSVIAFVCTALVWALAMVWKPTEKQAQLRCLQTVILSLHMLLLLQASNHALPNSATVLHALWLALLAVVLCAALCSVGVRVSALIISLILSSFYRFLFCHAWFVHADAAAEAAVAAHSNRAGCNAVEELQSEGGGQSSLPVLLLRPCAGGDGVTSVQSGQGKCDRSS
ncbi:MAG: hypothetical protein P4L87_20255 [Formivibrio sp.]|nr:hypothetical protein [Formivibrio sp.]